MIFVLIDVKYNMFFFTKFLIIGDRRHDTSREGAMGRVEKIHAKNKNKISHISMLPQENDTFCWQQVRQLLIILNDKDDAMKNIFRMFVWSLDEARVTEQALITIPISQSTPMPKLNVQNRCPAKIKLEEFQEEDNEWTWINHIIAQPSSKESCSL